MTTLKDVAAKAGITVTTVSRVLNNRGYISEETRQKVNDAMAELDYQPNEIARALFRKKSNILGVIVPDVSHPFFGELVSAIEHYASHLGYKIMLCNSYQDENKEEEYVGVLKRNKVDGIIIGSHTKDTSKYITPNFPAVAIDRNLPGNITVVTSDNYGGGELATNLLIDKGCKKIAHISGVLEVDTPANKRYEAFVNVAKERNIPYIVKEAKLDSFDSYKKLVMNLLKYEKDIDGIFASSDIIALAIINVAVELGKRIPQDIKIVGYDDISLSAMVNPSITTIKQPIKEMGQKIVDVLIEKIEGKEVSDINVLPVKLICRSTT